MIKSSTLLECGPVTKNGPPRTHFSEKFGSLEHFLEKGQNIWTPYEKIGPVELIFKRQIWTPWNYSSKIRPIWNTLIKRTTEKHETLLILVT